MRMSIRRAATTLPVLLLAMAFLGGCSVWAESGWGVRSQDTPRASLYKLNAEQIQSSSMTSVEALLEQHFSGFYYRTGDERPGATGQAYMLGHAAPLFIIDGVPIEYRGYLGLNPRDVESIEFVKHGAAAIYGMRGSAGAILITTRHN